MQEYFNAKQQLFVNSDSCFTSQEVYNQLDQSVKVKTKIYPTSYDLTTTHFV